MFCCYLFVATSAAPAAPQESAAAAPEPMLAALTNVAAALFTRPAADSHAAVTPPSAAVHTTADVIRIGENIADVSSKSFIAALGSPVQRSVQSILDGGNGNVEGITDAMLTHVSIPVAAAIQGNRKFTNETVINQTNDFKFKNYSCCCFVFNLCDFADVMTCSVVLFSYNLHCNILRWLLLSLPAQTM